VLTDANAGRVITESFVTRKLTSVQKNGTHARMVNASSTRMVMSATVPLAGLVSIAP